MADDKKVKNKKISKMKASEIDHALKKSTEHKNIDTSKYVQHLNQKLEEIRSKAK